MAHADNVYYPIYLDLRDRRCVVVGGGPIAAGKVSGLLDSGAQVTVVAPEVEPRIAQWHDAGRLVWLARDFIPDDIVQAFVVIAATDQPALNAHIYELANDQQRLANAVDDPSHCNFIAPAVAKVGALQVAVSTAGKSPALAKLLRDEIERSVLTPERARLADFLGEWRPQVKLALPTYQQRMAFWERVLRSPVPALLQGDDAEEVNHVMQELIEQMVEERICN